ncbi:MinD/ParA family protein [Actinomadura sp. BRA 177]|uniref:MinD/ParA family ATP-binding protein n=1 Tax=Actinomadura sp. BRA 177 TaxID=2745202 RepID=UPI0028168A90|nr:MinD/ParA family protein [Actinomadura sp. BRA 177]
MPAADEFVRKNQHGDALVRRMGRGVRKAVGASGQIRSQAEISEYLRRPVSGFRQITVVSVRGGAGKTTVAALIATELARHRPDRVLAMDADAELGSLPLRLGVRSELSLFELAAQQPRTFEEAARYMQQTREGLWVLAATRGGRITGEFDFDTFQSAFSAVSRYISTAVTDCSAGILTDLHRGILGQSHSVVLVTPGTVDGALSARGALEWFSQGGQQRLLPRTVIAMVSHAPQIGADLNRATQMLTAWGTPVVHVPYDRHIATGGAVDVSLLGEGTQAAVGRIACEAFARSLGDPGPSH